MPDAIHGDVTVSPFTPTAFVEAVTAAVLPLINEGNIAGLREGKTGVDVHQALVSLFGDYVIEDAVYTHRLLQHAHLHWDTTGGDDARCYAIREARTILLHFICKGISSGPTCTAARATCAEHRDRDGEELDSLHNSLHFRISHDISNLRAGRFHGQRFADTFWLQN